MSVNKVILVGHVGADPECKSLNEGKNKVANFNIATSDSYKDKNGNRVDNTDWHQIVMWGPLAELAEKYIKKGSLLYVEGKIQTRTWEDKEGKKRYTTEVVANTFKFLGAKKDGASSNGAETSTASTGSNATGSSVASRANQAVPASAEDDLPF
jgi:single-strand DNA-binding protein